MMKETIILLSINRIRLEFKVYNHIVIERHFLLVLIESDWNLKSFPLHQLSVYVFVLIESDWNLKDAELQVGDTWQKGINRIRLEFKENMVPAVI